MRRLFIEIHDKPFDVLQDLAIRERRDVRDQAALLLEEAVWGMRCGGTDSPNTKRPSRGREGVPA